MPISFRNSAMRRSKTIFVVSDKLGDGEAVVSGSLHATVSEKVTVRPYYLVLFLLFSLGELGITRE
jgi:hypothetical protein